VGHHAATVCGSGAPCGYSVWQCGTPHLQQDDLGACGSCLAHHVLRLGLGGGGEFMEVVVVAAGQGAQGQGVASAKQLLRRTHCNMNDVMPPLRPSCDSRCCAVRMRQTCTHPLWPCCHDASCHSALTMFLSTASRVRLIWVAATVTVRGMAAAGSFQAAAVARVLRRASSSAMQLQGSVYCHAGLPWRSICTPGDGTRNLLG
jgi:hypothetical protein